MPGAELTARGLLKYAPHRHAKFDLASMGRATSSFSFEDGPQIKFGVTIFLRLIANTLGMKNIPQCAHKQLGGEKRGSAVAVVIGGDLDQIHADDIALLGQAL